MSTQRFRLHVSVRFVTALAFASLLLAPAASSAAPGVRSVEDLIATRTQHPGVLESPPNPTAAEPRALPQPDVDPWDDDLSGKKPPLLTVNGTDPLCGSTDPDIAGESSLCTTLIASAPPVTGTLHDGTVGDQDLYSFRLPVPTVVTVEAISVAAVQLVVRNSVGQIVATAGSSGAGAPLRLVRALAPGRYFLEVESLSGEDALYAVTLHRPGR